MTTDPQTTKTEEQLQLEADKSFTEYLNEPVTTKCPLCEAHKNKPYNPALVRKIKKALKSKPKFSGTPKEFLKWLTQ